ncbi:MAG: sugar phosphate nucleotidyltransferase [Pirellulaceae bacterium]|jgi:mannose-1-phosphate guanylyltransferase|nr:sugar phosphate nucleotidyltransferase [Pirellulaceae bacterium]
MLYAMIMAGGSGTRFWPASRHARPKQLLNLAGELTMVQATAKRLGALVPPSRTLVLTNQRLVAPLARQLPELPAAAILGEPCRRDTAPAIGLAAALVQRQDADATLVVMPADHVIQPVAAFQRAISQAAQLVADQPARIVTFGIRPSYPAESFGYIERGEPLRSSRDGDAPAFAVTSFREKPAAAVAQSYLAAGRYYWNSGIFVWKARTILAALARFEPLMAAHLGAIAASFGTDRFDATFADEFSAIAGKSIDYAVMERYEPVVVVEAPFDWDDLGSWRALARLHGSDEQGNTRIGPTVAVRTTNSIIRSSNDHLIAAIGVDNLIVVHTPDATLVARQDDEESVREIVQLLHERGWDQYL